MTSTSVCPGFLFATLVVQMVQANGASIVVSPRHGGDDCDDEPGECHSAAPVTQTQTVTKTMVKTPPSSPSPSSSTTAISNSSSGTTTASALPTAASSTDPRLDTNLTKRPSISTGGIVGAVLGSLIILGLAIMLLSKCINRSRKARKRPKGFVQSGSFPSTTPQTPTTEMSQTQFSHPVISSNIVAQATSGPHPQSSVYYSTDDSSKASTFASSTPLIPAGRANVAHSVTSSSARRTSLSYTDVSSDAGHLPSPYDTATISSWHASQTSSAYGGSGVSSSLAAAAVAATVASPNASPLHRSMAAFQKALEDESNKANSAGGNVHDPPPQYDP